jgi:hypothetical protein
MADRSEAARLSLVERLPAGLLMQSWQCAYLAPGYFQVDALLVTSDGFGRVEVQGSGRTVDDAVDDLLSRTRLGARG